MAQVRVYRTYRFMEKDPVIGEMQTLLKNEGLFNKLDIAHQLSGVATQTLNNWFFGDTRSPQNRTLMAVATSLGYQRQFIKSRKLDIDRELKIAAAWAVRQNSSRPKPNRKAA